MDGRKAGIILAALLLVGCVTAYVDPSGPGTATVTIQNTAAVDLGIHAFKVGADCSGGRLRIADTQKLSSGQSISFKVKANEEFSFWGGYSQAGLIKETNCFMPVTFTPRPGEKYIARFALAGGRCIPSIASTTAAGEKKEPTFRLRKSKVSLTDSGSACE
jgi:hypothetical protein